MSAEIGVVYLHRALNGTAPLVHFATAYAQNPAGPPHDLVILAKGFTRNEMPADHRRVIADLGADLLHVPDNGYDIGSYTFAARTLVSDRLCFLNSHSTPIVAGWLQMLDDALRLPGVGAAGATGSWMSSRSSYDWRPERITRFPRRLAGKVQEAARYPGFPNPHLRTNAMLLDRALFLELRRSPIRTKSDAYRFESGHRSMTRQLTRRCLRAVVVSRDGRIWDIPKWRDSDTFWVGDQAGLLVKDNQTRKYDDATPQLKARLFEAAWAGGYAPSDSELRGAP